jgi:hypothetical protein
MHCMIFPSHREILVISVDRSIVTSRQGIASLRMGFIPLESAYSILENCFHMMELTWLLLTHNELILGTLNQILKYNTNCINSYEKSESL